MPRHRALRTVGEHGLVSGREDWAQVIKRLLDGDKAACFRISGLVRGYLAGRGPEFIDDWPDLIQEVLIAVIEGARGGRIRNPEASLGYICAIAHHKFSDRLRVYLGRKEGDVLELGEIVGSGDEPAAKTLSADRVVAFRRAVEELPENERKALVGVYFEGKTYDQVVEETGIPLGTLKRLLKRGKEKLKDRFGKDL